MDDVIPLELARYLTSAGPRFWHDFWCSIVYRDQAVEPLCHIAPRNRHAAPQ